MPDRFEDVPVTTPLRIFDPYHVAIGTAVGLLVQNGMDVFLWKQEGFWWVCREIDGINSGWLSGTADGRWYLAKLGDEGTAPGDPFVHILSRVHYEKRRKPR